jgi:hypothetical protein
MLEVDVESIEETSLAEDLRADDELSAAYFAPGL